MQEEDRSTQPVNFINFHGLNLLVARHQGIDYVEAKPLSDLSGVDWRGARRALQEGDNARLYGVQRLIPPQIAGLGGLKSPDEGVLYLRLDRAHMYLARISTDRMRANGNTEGAEKVLALQEEWAKVLHTYETHGVVVKSSRSNALRDVLGLQKARNTCTDPRERAAFTRLLHLEMAAIGMPLAALDEPQQPLPLTQPN